MFGESLVAWYVTLGVVAVVAVAAVVYFVARSVMKRRENAPSGQQPDGSPTH